MFKDNLFKKIEKKTNIDKDTILSIADRLQKSNMKDKSTLESFVDEISTLAGKNVSKEKKEKIVNTILNNDVEKEMNKLI